MAYLQNNLDDEKKNEQPGQAQGQVSLGSGPADGGAAPAPGAAPLQQAAPQQQQQAFPGIQAYLNANKGAGDKMYQKVTEGMGGAINAAKAEADKNVSDFKSQEKKASEDWNNANLQAYKNVTPGGRFQEIAYQAPTYNGSHTSFDAAKGRYDQILKSLGDDASRQQLIQGAYGKTGTAGENRLDSMLLGNMAGRFQNQYGGLPSQNSPQASNPGHWSAIGQNPSTPSNPLGLPTIAMPAGNPSVPVANGVMLPGTTVPINSAGASKSLPNGVGAQYSGTPGQPVMAAPTKGITEDRGNAARQAEPASPAPYVPLPAPTNIVPVSQIPQITKTLTEDDTKEINRAPKKNAKEKER